MYDDKYIEEVAKATIKILKEHKAVRLADNLNPDGVDVGELLAELEDKGFPVSQTVYYNKIRPKCEQLGYGITAVGKGQFIGKPGESVARNVFYARQQIVGRTANQRKYLTAASEAMTIEDGNEYSRVHFGMNLLDSANVFEAVGKMVGDPLLAWPKELKQYLLEASKK